MSTRLKYKVIGFAGLILGCGLSANNLTDMQSDAQTQRTVHQYPFGGIGGTDALTAPDQIVCVLRQLWKPEFLGIGNVHVQVNEKQCFGVGEGDEAIDAVVNISTDPQTGDTVGKVWYNDIGSVVYGGANVTLYFQLRVTASPSASEPYGRFEVDVIEELQATSELISTMKISASGNNFRFAQKTSSVSLISSAGVFSMFANAATKQAAYHSGSSPTTIGYDATNICFENSGTTQCFLREAANPTISVGSHGIYNVDGSRYLGTVSALSVNGTTVSMAGGFGTPITNLVAPNVGEPIGMIDSSATVLMSGQAMKVQWLSRVIEHSDPGILGSISMSVDTNQLLDPNSLTDFRSSVGPIPSSTLLEPLKAKGGKLL
jgi:hypothetical protein